MKYFSAPSFLRTLVSLVFFVVFALPANAAGDPNVCIEDDPVNGGAICAAPTVGPWQYGICMNRNSYVADYAASCRARGGTYNGAYASEPCTGASPGPDATDEAAVLADTEAWLRERYALGGCPLSYTKDGWLAQNDAVDGYGYCAVPSYGEPSHAQFEGPFEVRNVNHLNYSVTSPDADGNCTQEGSESVLFEMRSRELVCSPGYDKVVEPDRIYCRKPMLVQPEACGAASGGPTNPFSQPSGASQSGDPGNANGRFDNPVNPITGAKIENEVLYRGSGPFPLLLALTYNSYGFYTAPDSPTPTQSMGRNWRHNYDFHIFPGKENSGLLASAPRNGVNKVNYFDATGSQLSFAGSAANDRVTKVAQGWTYVDASAQSSETYNEQGRLTSITNKAGFTQTITYADVNGKSVVDYVEDFSGRRLDFEYDGNARIKWIDTPDGRFTFEYTALGELEYIAYPDDDADETNNPRFQYHYENPQLPGFITGKTDERGIRVSTVTYHNLPAKSVKSSQSRRGVTYYFDYRNDKTLINSSEGMEWWYGWEYVDGVYRLNGVNGRSAPSGLCGNGTRSIFYDVNNNLNGQLDWEGNRTSHVNNPKGQHESTTQGVGSPVERSFTTQWHPEFNKPELITGPGAKLRDPEYNANGQLTSYTMTDTNLNTSRTWTYTYCQLGEVDCVAGLLKSIDGPRTDISDITTYRYYTSGAFTGLLKETQNALGHITQYTDYDASGRVKRVVDANGLATEYDYTPRGWLEEVRQGDAVTTFVYNLDGTVERMIFPDLSIIESDTRTSTLSVSNVPANTRIFLRYEYDNLGRVTDIYDAQGNQIHYTLNAQGGAESEEIRDPNGVVHKLLSRTFDEINRVHETIGAASQTAEIRWDRNSNPDYEVDPKTGLQTNYDFDALKRLTSITEALSAPEQGVTTLTYDDWDNLNNVIDPNTNVTDYDRDALGNLRQIVSPDTGTTTFTHDNAGNIKTKTDARGITTTYAYDALNRLQSIRFPTSAENITYAYDQTSVSPQGAIGRLTTVTDQSGITTYRYSQHGNLLRETRSLEGLDYVTSYAWDRLGNLRLHIYPDQLFNAIGYEYTVFGQVARVLVEHEGTPSTLLDNLQYKPFGPLTSWTYGNGITANKPYDLDYQLTDIQMNGAAGSLINRHYDYDLAGNVDVITDNLNANQSEDFSYDARHRLATANSAYGYLEYGYDKNGNRSSFKQDSVESIYTTQAGNNRLDSISGPSNAAFTYDAMGNTKQKGNQTFSYNDQARLSLVEESGTEKARYTYNAMGQRTSKVIDNKTTVYHYDLSGLLIGETDVLGNPMRSYIYFNGMPVAAYYGGPRVTGSSVTTQAIGACTGTTASNSQHVTNNRAHTTSQTTGQTCWGTFCWGGTTTTTYWSNGDNANLGTNANTQTTLYQGNNGNWYKTDPADCVIPEPNPNACPAFTATNDQHVTANRETKQTTTTGGTCWGSFCWGQTTVTSYTVVGSNEGLGNNVGSQNQTLFESPAGYFQTVDPENCGGPSIELPDPPPYEGWLYLLTDHLNSPTHAVDASGNVLWQVVYRPFGEVSTVVDSVGGVLLRRPGQYYDEETGLYYNWFRTYDPETGRYITSDPIGLDGGINTFLYANANPLKFFDPFGLAPNPQCVAACTAGGSVIGGGLGYAGGGLVGAGGGTLVAPGVGTVGGAIGGAELGGIGGAIIGGTLGNALGNAMCPDEEGEEACDMSFVRQVYYGGDTKTCVYKSKGNMFTFPQDENLPCMPVDHERCLVDTSLMGPKARAIYGR